MQQVEASDLRIRAIPADGRYYLQFDCWREDNWVTVLATGVVSPPHMFRAGRALLCEDPVMEWVDGTGGDTALRRADAFLSEAVLADHDQSLVLSGAVDDHRIEEIVTIVGPRHAHVAVTGSLNAPDATLRLGRLMSHLYFVPDGKAERTAEPLDFAWLPNLHTKEEHVCANHFFRSPAVIVLSNGYFAALVPDLRLFAQHRTIAQALDLRTTGTVVEAPRLSYGICPWSIDGHTYSGHTPSTTTTV